MASLKKTEQTIVGLKTLEELTRVYGEIASIRMKNTRDDVLSARAFITAVNNVFKEVLSTYRREVMRILKEKGTTRKEGFTMLAHNGKVVSVLLSANTGLYGSIVRDAFNLFIKDVQEGDSEVSIVGRLGKAVYIAEYPGRPYTYFDLPDSGTDVNKLSELVRHLVQYEEIRVYFGQFQNVLKQTPTVFRISAESVLADVLASEDEKQKNFLFEPSLEKVMQFFETEIFASLFEQSVKENQLAKFASRILAMDEAQSNIKDRLKDTELEVLRVKHRIKNSKQLNTLSSFSSWKVNG